LGRSPGARRARRLQARQRLRERREEKRREASAAAAPDPALLRAREAAASAAEAELLREEAEEVRPASRVPFPKLCVHASLFLCTRILRLPGTGRSPGHDAEPGAAESGWAVHALFSACVLSARRAGAPDLSEALSATRACAAQAARRSAAAAERARKAAADRERKRAAATAKRERAQEKKRGACPAVGVR